MYTCVDNSILKYSNQGWLRSKKNWLGQEVGVAKTGSRPANYQMKIRLYEIIQFTEN